MQYLTCLYGGPRCNLSRVQIKTSVYDYKHCTTVDTLTFTLWLVIT